MSNEFTSSEFEHIGHIFYKLGILKYYFDRFNYSTDQQAILIHEDCLQTYLALGLTNYMKSGKFIADYLDKYAAVEPKKSFEDFFLAFIKKGKRFVAKRAPRRRLVDIPLEYSVIHSTSGFTNELGIEKRYLVADPLDLGKNIRVIDEALEEEEQYQRIKEHVARGTTLRFPPGLYSLDFYDRLNSDYNVEVCLNSPFLIQLYVKNIPGLFDECTRIIDVYPGFDSQKVGLMEMKRVQEPGWEAVHRLDIPAQGLMIIARSKPVISLWHYAFAMRQVYKTYSLRVSIRDRILENIVYVENWIDLKPFRDKKTGKEKIRLLKVKVLTGDEDELDIKLGQNKEGNKDGAYSMTKLIPGPVHSTYQEVRAVIASGRRHQVRLALASISMPIMGDKVYNPANDKNSILYLRCIRIDLNDWSIMGPGRTYTCSPKFHTKGKGYTLLG